jgi:predicted nucleic acid-binding Zn ribbon protein
MADMVRGAGLESNQRTGPFQRAEATARAGRGLEGRVARAVASAVDDARVAVDDAGIASAVVVGAGLP